MQAGTGKTPIVAALVSGWQEKGVKVGIISRGYGRKSKAVHVLNTASSAADAGDEPLLLFRQTGAPTAVGSSRAEAGRALFAAHPELELIVTDDGLQHYALQRDMEIAVFPAADTGRTDLITAQRQLARTFVAIGFPLMRSSSVAERQMRHLSRLKICLSAILKQGGFTG